MDDRTQGALMLAVGGVSLRLGLTDAALAYVKAGLRPPLAVAGVVLLVLGVVALVRAFRQPVSPASAEELAEHEGHEALLGHESLDHDDHAGHDDPVGQDHDHDHGHGPAVAWLLVLPLLALLLIAPPPLGAFAAARAGAGNLTTTRTSYPPLPDPVDGAVELTFSEYVFRALYDEDRSLQGQRIRLVGFVTEDPDAQPGSGGYLLTRFRLSCCAADGMPVSVAVTADPQPRAVETWLEVEGTWEPRPEAEPGVPSTLPPVMVASSVDTVAQPDQPYEY